MEHERIIQIYEYLCRYTDEIRSVTIKEIQEHLSKSGNMKDVSALTIRRDIDRLTAMGNDIRKETGAHNTARYSLINKGFTFNEIRFIVDSISINKFLSSNQKHRLIKKFEGMCSESEVRQLISRISLNGRNVPNLDLLENLERVHKIISKKRKIDFAYGKSNAKGELDYYSKKRNMIPVKVVYFDDRFYLKCINAETQQVRVYRIDRMKDIIGGETVNVIQKLPKYDGAVLDMFEPKYFEYVTLKVKRFLLDDMLEQFGKYAFVSEITDEPESVIIRAKIGISDSFYRWLMKYSSNIEIVSPESIRLKFLEELKKVFEIYGK